MRRQRQWPSVPPSAAHLCRKQLARLRVAAGVSIEERLERIAVLFEHSKGAIRAVVAELAWLGHGLVRDGVIRFPIVGMVAVPEHEHARRDRRWAGLRRGPLVLDPHQRRLAETVAKVEVHLLVWKRRAVDRRDTPATAGSTAGDNRRRMPVEVLGFRRVYSSTVM